jgi:hypothetical protein
MIVISKADLFSLADRQQMISYVKANLLDQLRVDPPVHAVSVFGAGAAMCDRWFESELRPLLAQHQELAITSQKRKIGTLREAVMGGLERRLQSSSETLAVGTTGVSAEATEALRNGDRILERAQGESFFLTRKIAKMQRAIIDVAAQRIAAALIESGNADTGSIFSETLKSLIAEPVAATLRSIEQTRSALAKTVETAASASEWSAPDELPKPAGMPMLDINEIFQKIMIEKPRLLSLLGKNVLASHVRRRMEQSINALRNALMSFLTSIARTLKARRLRLIPQRSKETFGFCANGKLLMQCLAAATEFCVVVV